MNWSPSESNSSSLALSVWSERFNTKLWLFVLLCALCMLLFSGFLSVVCLCVFVVVLFCV